MLKGITAKKSNLKKEMLIDLAKNGGEKPSKNTLLFNALRNYMNKSSCSYDLKFANKIKKIRPDWFAIEKEDLKTQIVNYAKDNRKKPDYETFKKIKEFVNVSHVNYDPKFTAIIMSIRSEWFINANDRRKNILIKMANKGMKRPNSLKSLGRHLCIFVSKNNKYYDAEFTNKIKKIRPDWFRKI